MGAAEPPAAERKAGLKHLKQAPRDEGYPMAARTPTLTIGPTRARVSPGRKELRDYRDLRYFLTWRNSKARLSLCPKSWPRTRRLLGASFWTADGQPGEGP